MSIPIKKEPEEILKHYGVLEHCHFCKKVTLYWHENTNNAVCPECSKKHKVAELPDYGKTIRRNKYKENKLKRKGMKNGN